jgi:ADP-L-glycero-D-manno-heptose 6-epimerase
MNDFIIVTGGAGLIGSNLAASLNADGHANLLIVDHLNHADKDANLAALRYQSYMEKEEFRSAFLAGRIEAPTTVYHLGACSSTMETDAAYLTSNNIDYTKQLCRWTLEQGGRFVYASSAATYGDGDQGYGDDHAGIPALKPLNLYGQSKQDVDLWALESGIIDRVAGIKYFNVYGPGEGHKGEMRSLINKAYYQIQETGRLKLFRSHRPDYKDGEQDRDFVYVKDAVAVTRFLGEHPAVNGIYNCGTGGARTWVDLAHAIFAAMDRPPAIDFIDMPESIRDKYQYHTAATIEKLGAAGYTAPFTTMEAAVDDYVRQYLAK